MGKILEVTKKAIAERDALRASRASKAKKHSKTATTATTATSATSSTKYNTIQYNNNATKHERLRASGDIINGVVIEPLGFGQYVFNANGKRGNAEVMFENEEGQQGVLSENPKAAKKAVSFFLDIAGQQYKFIGYPLMTKLPFILPSVQSVNAYIARRMQFKPFKDIFESLINISRVCFDLEKEEYHAINALGIMQSWLMPCLSSIFLLSRDGTKGSAKTSYAELTAGLCRHGITLGNTSSAVIGRIVENYQGSLHIDELDNLKPEVKEEVEGILRKSQRRNNPYSRCNKNTGAIEFFEVFGYHSISYRGDSEDALKSRSFPIRTKPTTDYRLSIINLSKDTLLQPVFEDVFFWYMENIATIKKKSEGAAQ